jgi:alginate O-acetyltransferase complex protein AlgI
MVFNSFTYIFFLVLVVLLYWHCSPRGKLYVIFVSSLTFYSFWRFDFVWLLLLSVAVDYSICHAMVCVKPKRRKLFVLTSLIFNLGLLFIFKYFLFFADEAVGLLNLLGFVLDPILINIILPIGISFYTFQTISYTVDVYRGTVKPECDFIFFACYVTFFPQLVAGPILRFDNVAKQFRKNKKFNPKFLVEGIKFILIGFFLKTVLADNIALFVDEGFQSDVRYISALDVWTLAFLFGFQIYFDFSAYSFIARGSAFLMGIKFPRNFNFPFLASSPRDFWQRWHVSLSSWIKDYIYIPLVKCLVSRHREHNFSRVFSLFVTWALMGFWHGANWTFLFWGFSHAVIISISRMPFLASALSRSRLVGIALTLPLMMICWIPFRAPNLDIASSMFLKVIDPSLYLFLGLHENIHIVTFSITAGFFVNVAYSHYKEKFLSFGLRQLVEFWIWSIIIFLTFVFFRKSENFIYFQF